MHASPSRLEAESTEFLGIGGVDDRIPATASAKLRVSASRLDERVELHLP
jgi:hypothetical protein